MGFCPIGVLFCDQKSTRKVPLLPRRGARPRGCSPLGTPKGWSRSKKAKKRRSAAFFFTLFHFSPIDPSGAKMVDRGWLPLRGAPAGRRVRGGPGSTHLTPTTPQSPSVTAPLKGSQMSCRGEQCSPEGFSGGARLPGRISNPPLRFSGKVVPCKAPPVTKVLQSFPAIVIHPRTVL